MEVVDMWWDTLEYNSNTIIQYNSYSTITTDNLSIANTNLSAYKHDSPRNKHYEIGRMHPHLEEKTSREEGCSPLTSRVNDQLPQTVVSKDQPP